MKSLPANFSWLRFSDVLGRFIAFLFLEFEFYNHNHLFFPRRSHAWRSSGITSWPVRERVLQTLSSSSSFLIDVGTGFISINSRRWYWALLIAFLSSQTSRLQFFETGNSRDRISNLLVKSSNRVVRFTSLEEISSKLISSSINSSFESCSNWLLVRTIVKDILK